MGSNLLQNFIDNLTGMTALRDKADLLEAQISGLQEKEMRRAIEWKDLTAKYNALFSAKQAEDNQLASCTQDATSQAAQIATLQAQLAQAQAATIRDIYANPCPSLLEECESQKVILGDFAITTAQGTQTLAYPDHPSVFMPCPIFEFILTLADCNRPRNDIADVQICKRISNTIQQRNSYLDDQTQWKRPDNWAPAPVTLLLRREDCESLAHLIASGIQYHELKFGALKTLVVDNGNGHFIYGGNSYGHSYVLLMHKTSSDLKDNYVIEATDTYASDPLPLDKYGKNYSADWGVIGFPRRDFSGGTYQVKTPWWGEIRGVISMNTMDKIRGALGADIESEKKKEALKKFAEERQQEVKP
jgi:hypothetical protein